MAEVGFEPSLSDAKPMLVPLVSQTGKLRNPEFKHSDGTIGSPYTALLGQPVTRGQESER